MGAGLGKTQNENGKRHNYFMFYRFSPRLVLRSPWRPYVRRRGERVLVIRADATFSPAHPTTRLCLDLLQETLAPGPPRRLLDVGCGSGVLLLAGAAGGIPLYRASSIPAV
jgi:ribosomal protein L11 methylase PrmA